MTSNRPQKCLTLAKKWRGFFKLEIMYVRLFGTLEFRLSLLRQSFLKFALHFFSKGCENEAYIVYKYMMKIF